MGRKPDKKAKARRRGNLRNFRLDDESRQAGGAFQLGGLTIQGVCRSWNICLHVPNGGKRDAATAIALKRQGVKAGVPDICLPAPRGIYHGLYIELKAGKNTTTAKQRSWLDYLRQQGYFTAVCYGWQTAAELVERYLLHTGQLGEPGQTLGKGVTEQKSRKHTNSCAQRRRKKAR